ncbi:hypothetical protein LINPERHAP2_LOCUS29915, partial [Linum perenne]
RLQISHLKSKKCRSKLNCLSPRFKVFSLPLLLLLVPLYMKSLLLTVKCVDCSFLACTVQIDNAEMEMGIGVYKQQSITWIMDGLQNIILTCYC